MVKWRADLNLGMLLGSGPCILAPYWDRPTYDLWISPIHDEAKQGKECYASVL